jgi:D-sedoheptulose 7-phosphate isomerase
MTATGSVPRSHFAVDAASYLQQLQDGFSPAIIETTEILAQELLRAWTDGSQVYICGNGGSAANAIHMANDFHYGIGACGAGPHLPGLRVEALPANAGIITCLANDTGYENIYAHQLQVKGRKDDVLIVLSGSGNSANVVRALETAKRIGMKSFAILAFSGGRCLELADIPIHFTIDDMQIAEDTQLVVGHLCMKWLNANKPHSLNELP